MKSNLVCCPRLANLLHVPVYLAGIRLPILNVGFFIHVFTQMEAFVQLLKCVHISQIHIYVEIVTSTDTDTGLCCSGQPHTYMNMYAFIIHDTFMLI